MSHEPEWYENEIAPATDRDAACNFCRRPDPGRLVKIGRKVPIGASTEATICARCIADLTALSSPPSPDPVQASPSVRALCARIAAGGEQAEEDVTRALLVHAEAVAAHKWGDADTVARLRALAGDGGR